jgi:hypothetical protein
MFRIWAEIRKKLIAEPGSRGKKAPDPRSGSTTLNNLMKKLLDSLCNGAKTIKSLK